MLKLGSTDINKAYLGSTEINKIYLGVDEVFSVVPIVQPLRTVVTQNRVSPAFENRSRTHQLSRWPFVIAQDCTSIVISNNNWNLSNQGEGGPTNSITVSAQSLELDSGQTTPVYFSGGRSVTLATGDYDVQSDEIPASAFGLSAFASGTIIWVKTIISLSSSTHSIPYVGDVGEWPNAQGAWYNAGETTVSNIDTFGMFTSTGVPLSGRGSVYKPIILGRPVVDRMSWIYYGDSIGQGAGAFVQNTKIHGVGSFQYAAYDGTVLTGPFIPSLNFCRTGQATIWAAFPRCLHYAQYARAAADQYGANDIGQTGAPSSIETYQSARITFWSLLRSLGIEKIFRPYLIPRTNSTDIFKTAAGQVWDNTTGSLSYAKWGPGQLSTQMNAWFEEQLIAGNIDAVSPTSSIRDVSESEKWLTNGTNNYPTSDGTHPSDVFHMKMGQDDWRDVILAVSEE